MLYELHQGIVERRNGKEFTFVNCSKLPYCDKILSIKYATVSTWKSFTFSTVSCLDPKIKFKKTFKNESW